MGVPGCGKKKPPASTTVDAPKPLPDPNQEAGERVQREVEVGYLYAGIPGANALPKEDFDGDGEADLDRLTFDTQLRLQQLILARQLGIGFGREHLKAEQARRFTGADGRVNTAVHQVFLEKTLPNSGLTAADWDRFVANEMALTHLHQLISLTGVLLPSRVAHELFMRDHELFETEIIQFAATNHIKSVVIPSNALPAYYTNHLNRYLPPVQLDLVQVRIPFSLFEGISKQPVAEVEESVKKIYQQRGASAFKGDDGKSLPPEAAYQRLRCEVLAGRRFAALAKEIQKGVKADVARLREVLAQDQAKSKLKLESITASAGAIAPESLRAAVRAVESLRVGALAADPVFTADALSLVGLAKRAQAPPPPFAGLAPAQRVAIREDYIAEKSREIANTRGHGLHQLLTERMASGESLANVVASAGLKPVALPFFTLAQTAWPKARILPAIGLDVAQESVHVLLSKPAPTVGAFVEQPWGGFIMHLKKRTSVSATTLAKEFGGYQKLLRAQGLNAARQPSAQISREAVLMSGPPGWFLPELERLRLALFVELKGNSAAHARAVAAARKRLQGWPEPLGAETSAAVSEISPEDLKANDALLKLSLSTNVVKPGAWQQLAKAHPQTPAARRARLLGAVAFFIENRPKEAGENFADLKNVVDPLTPIAQLGHAVCLDEQGDPGAAAAYRRTIAANPRHLAAVIARLGLAALEKQPGLCQEVIENDLVGYWARLADGLRQRLR
ncbi:MAG: hypothetical protein VX705_06280 [Verrucomicrobiota bacterium]|nr:hypothetical protein [Verrucomicrobiota bacterium]